MPGLEFGRYYTREGVDPFDEVEWELRSAGIAVQLVAFAISLGLFALVIFMVAKPQNRAKLHSAYTEELLRALRGWLAE